MNRIERQVGRLASFFNGIATAAVVGMMVLTCLDVLLRLLRHPIPGTYEIVGLLGAVFISFSLARTSVDQGHIAVDFLVQRFPQRLQHAVEAINTGICALLFTVECGQCVLYARDLKASGCFIDALAFFMLTVPIFFPVIVSMGYDPMWFVVIIVLVTQIGVITPPVGVNVYVVSGGARTVPLEVIFKGVVPLLIALIVGVALMIPFPQIALFLPGLMK